MSYDRELSSCEISVTPENVVSLPRSNHHVRKQFTKVSLHKKVFCSMDELVILWVIGTVICLSFLVLAHIIVGIVSGFAICRAL